MDLWVVAAVTGAGYLGKYWQNLSGEKDEGVSDMFSIHKRLESKSLLHPIVNQRKLPHNDYLEKERDSSVEFQEILSASISSGTGNIAANTENYMNYNQVIRPEVLHRFRNKQGSSNTKKSLKCRRSRIFIVEPLDISESCLMSEYEKMEESEDIFQPISTPSARPLLMIDGTRRISRDSFDVRFHNSQDLVKRLSGLIELPRKPEQRHSRSSFHSQDVSSTNEMLPYFIGISIGVISTFVENTREVDRVNELIVHKENLVQDLHDELELKERMKVKEINPSSVKTELTADNCNHDKAESPDSMSKIEAELVAELETLELNMKSARHEGISDFVQLDSDDDEASGTHTTRNRSGNYAVSPIELRLRLHELIESRLQARILELEIALKNTCSQFCPTESQSAYDEIYEQTNKTRDSESEDEDEILAKILMKETR